MSQPGARIPRKFDVVVVAALVESGCLRAPVVQELDSVPMHVEVSPSSAVAEHLEFSDSCAVSGLDLRLVSLASKIVIRDTCDGDLRFLAGWHGDLQVTALQPVDLVFPDQFTLTSLRLHGDITGVRGGQVAPKSISVYALSFDMRTISPGRLEMMEGLFGQYSSICDKQACSSLRAIQVYDSLSALQLQAVDPGHVLESATFVVSQPVSVGALLAWKSRSLKVTVPALELIQFDPTSSVVERLNITCTPECISVRPLLGPLPESLEELALRNLSDSEPMVWDLTSLHTVSFDGVQVPNCELRLAQDAALHLSDSAIGSITFVEPRDPARE